MNDWKMNDSERKHRKLKERRTKYFGKVLGGSKDNKGRCGPKRIAYVTVEKQDILVRVRTFKTHFLQKPCISHTYM